LKLLHRIAEPDRSAAPDGGLKENLQQKVKLLIGRSTNR
jgi:hypothetical protein